MLIRSKVRPYADRLHTVDATPVLRDLEVLTNTIYAWTSYDYLDAV